MSDAAGRKPLDLGLKFVSAERALAAIWAGSRIYVGTGCAAPRNLLASLEAMVPPPPDLEFVSFITTSAVTPHTRYRHRAFFVGSELRGLAGSGPTHYVPNFARGGAGTPIDWTAANRRGVASGFPT